MCGVPEHFAVTRPVFCIHARADIGINAYEFPRWICRYIIGIVVYLIFQAFQLFWAIRANPAVCGDFEPSFFKGQCDIFVSRYFYNFLHKKIPSMFVHKSSKNGQWKKKPLYGRIKTTTIGGICMPRSYGHMKEYEKEILKLKEEGYTKREIGEKLGFTKEQIHNFITRYNANQRKLAAGIALRRKGRPPKDTVVSEQDKVTELKYILARKEAKIKSLEMENELMRDFLSLTERK